MAKKNTFFVFTILALGLGIVVLVIFIDREPVSEPFLCNGQPCNIILIIPEALSARHVGIYGYERDTTPFIDKFFSEESIIFENAWSAAPWTLPSFAALFTSQLASEVFVETVLDKLSEAIPTFVDVLEEKEIPKLVAHNTAYPFEGPVDWGFTTRFKTEERFRGEDPLLFFKAVEWIEDQSQKKEREPFFLLLQPYAPHAPYNPPEPYRYFFDAPLEYPGPVTIEEIREVHIALYKGEDVDAEKLERFRLQYDQEIRYIDSEFESFIARIPEEVIQNTIFIFTSDHGQAFGQHRHMAHANSVYEEEIHIPFLIRAPGLEPRRIREPITLLDAGPTILDIFGLESPEIFQGVSLLPALQEEELGTEDRIVRSENIFPRPPRILDWAEIEPEVRTGPLLLERVSVEQNMPLVRRLIAVRKGEWKLIIIYDYRDTGTSFTFELYNLEQDPEEQNNLIPQWRLLSKEEQIEAIPLFEVLGKSLPEE